MGGGALQVRFVFVLSISFAVCQTSSSSPFNNPKTLNPSLLSRFFPFKPRSCLLQSHVSTLDLLSLLGTEQQASSINPDAADKLRSCFKFLVPFIPNPRTGGEFEARAPKRCLSSKRTRKGDNELIWWPPDPVLELARLAIDSGGDSGAIQRALDPTMIQVPGVEGSEINKCQLTRTPYGRCFINKEINSYLRFLFELIASRGPEIGLNVLLNRFDLFHGHLFLTKDSRRLGILFHAKEYPAYGKQLFPFNMGYCQIGSTVTYDDSMNLRNILWLAPLASNSTKAWLTQGVLVALDANPEGIIYRDLVPEYVDYTRTLYEDDFGDVVMDVNCLNVGDSIPYYQIFIC